MMNIALQCECTFSSTEIKVCPLSSDSDEINKGIKEFGSI